MNEQAAFSKKILVIDDDPGITKMISERLKANGYGVLTSTDASEGLEMAFTEAPDLIILDVMMPIINGYNFCRLLKAEKKLKNIPVLMVTGRTEEADKEIGKEVGADAYITKPFEMGDLLGQIKSFLRE